MICVRRLQRQDKLLFKINCAFDKDEAARFIISDSIAYFIREYIQGVPKKCPGFKFE